MLVHEHLIFMKDKKLQGKLHAVSNMSVFISSLEKYSIGQSKLVA